MKGQIKSRSRGSYTIVVALPRGLDAKRRREVFTVKGTRKEAEAAMARRIAEVEGGTLSNAGRMTVNEFLDRYLAAAVTKVGHSTWRRYGGIAKYYLRPTLGSIKLAKLTSMQVEEAIAQWRRLTRTDRKSGPISPRTLHHVFTTLKAALARAVRWNLIPRNPCDSVDAPSKGSAEIKALDGSQAARLIEGLRGTALAAPTAIALMTGVRRGELLALKWEDIDFNRSTLSVRRSLELAGAQLRFKEPKTTKSRRLLHLPSQAVSALKVHRLEQAKMRLALGSGYKDMGLVFPAFDGGPWAPDKFSSAFYYKIRALSLPEVSFHGLRHSFASIMHDTGASLKVMSEALGHTTIAVTANLYTHVLGSQQREAADRLGSALESADSLNRSLG